MLHDAQSTRHRRSQLALSTRSEDKSRLVHQPSAMPHGLKSAGNNAPLPNWKRPEIKHPAQETCPHVKGNTVVADRRL